jgi:putative oxidoreductase
MLTHERVLVVLRWSLGLVFLWFGILKLFNTSASLDLFKASLPPVFGESQLYYFSIALLEIIIGGALIAHKVVKFVVIVMILHLIGETIFVFATQAFDPRFPVLSLAGELVLKNFVLIAAGLLLLVEREKREEKEKPKPETPPAKR